jgi:hypothetical protein
VLLTGVLATGGWAAATAARAAARFGAAPAAAAILVAGPPVPAWPRVRAAARQALAPAAGRHAAPRPGPPWRRLGPRPAKTPFPPAHGGTQ